MTSPQSRLDVVVRPLVERDLPEADRILRLAFGTFLGAPDPAHFMGDMDFARTRWKADPSAVIAAEYDGKLIGSSYATNWGSFGFVGPLTVHPDFWDRGVGQQLLPPTMEMFDRWGCRHVGLHTFSHVPKHMALYRKFGFWPRHLIAVMSKEVGPPSNAKHSDAAYFSELDAKAQSQTLAACREVTEATFEGLDVGREIRAIADQKLGDTILLWEGSKLSGFAVCHIGAGTEAGSGVCYVKFAAVHPGRHAGADLYRLIDACESLARSRGAHKIVAGVNLARRGCFDRLFKLGFRTETQGIAMETGDETSGYNHAVVFVLDDWH